MKTFKKGVWLTIIMLFAFVCKAYANSYDISFTTKANNTLKTGDIIDVTAGIACKDPDEYYVIATKDFDLLYDMNVFELLDSNGKLFAAGGGDTTNAFKIRNGWISSNWWLNTDGVLTISLNAKNDTYYIPESETGDTCIDDKNADIITFKLRVKSTTNQDTKIKLVDETKYTKELNFRIFNPSENNNLSSLTVEGFELDKEFNKNNTVYETYVPYATDKVNISAVAEDQKSTVIGTGEKELTVGDNKISITVTSESGAKKVYSLNIIRKEANDETSLSKVSVLDSNNKELKLKYDEKTKTYSGKVKSDITFVSFDIKCSGEECFVDELKPSSLNFGKNTFKFTVISQNQDKETYKIIIDKEALPKDNSKLFLTIGIGVFATTSIVLCAILLKNKKKQKKEIELDK